MKKQTTQLFLYREGDSIKYAVPLITTIILLATALDALMLNTMGLRETLQQNTIDYGRDVSTQLVNSIVYRMESREIYIQNLADTFAGMPEFLLTKELLDRKAEYLEMDDIFVVNADGTTIPADEEHASLSRYLAEHPEPYTEPQIFFTGSEEVFFSAPIIRKTGEDALLVGTRSNNLLQQMLQNVDFKDQGLCCIVNKDGTVIVSTTDETPFIELKDIFAETVNTEDDDEGRRVLEDINAHRSGMAQFNSLGEDPVLLGYNFLGINDWMLLTLISADLFSEDTTPYLIRYITIIGILTLVMLTILASVVWYYRRTLGHIRAIALTDPLTGGHNDLAFRIDGEKLCREHPERTYAIIYLNIRKFKQFNEHFGVQHGDELLRQISQSLRDLLQEGELLCRNAGDHFYLLLACADEDSVRRRLTDMLAELERRLSPQFAFEQVRFAQGAYLIQERDADFMLLTDRAKAASAYAQGDDHCQFYDDAMGKRLEREHALEVSFQSAIENHEFRLYIQPKVQPGQGTASGGEVLVRWQHPAFGLLFPGEFIPLFERDEKICDLDFYVFEETCRLLKSWLAEGRAIPLSVNLSRAHLISNDFAFLDRFKAIKDRYEIPDGFIELELTESLMLERRDIRLVTAMIDRIREMGFLCSIDDFGFGYSSLALLKDLNVTAVKLDRQFFLDENEKSWLVVEQLIRLAHSLDMTVVAEGIEEQAQVEQLYARGCDLVQGYVYAKPLPASDFACWSGQ